MELGPIQKQWLADLKAYPERQFRGSLGIIEIGNIQACCLGQALLTLCEVEGKTPDLTKDGDLIDIGDHYYIGGSYRKIGLRSGMGTFLKPEIYNSKSYFSLSEMNDSNVPWIDIAKYIETNPENVFIESK